MCLIELAENGIDDGGAAALCTLLDPGVGCCMALNHLHLRGNMIGDSGALRLLASAGRLPSLRWLAHRDRGGGQVRADCRRATCLGVRHHAARGRADRA